MKAPLSQLPLVPHIANIQKLSEPEGRLWYAAAAVEHGWSRNVSDVGAASTGCPMTEVTPSSGAFIIILAAPSTALVDTAVFGVFDMPLVPNIQPAHQGLQHESSLISMHCLRKFNNGPSSGP